ncbi:MAG: hypothetical protein ACXWR1_03805 [Bdellovibrionota bacterium]
MKKYAFVFIVSIALLGILRCTTERGAFEIRAQLNAPPRLQKYIKSGEGFLVVWLASEGAKFGPPIYIGEAIPQAHFPYSISISGQDIERFQKLHGSGSGKLPKGLVLRAFYCVDSRNCRPTEAFAYMRSAVPENRGAKIDLGKVYFQGYNPRKQNCPKAKGTLLAGRIRLHSEVEKHFSTRTFLLAIVGQTTDGEWRNTRYVFVKSQPIDLDVTNEFRVSAKGLLLPKDIQSRFLLYLLDDNDCLKKGTQECAEKLIANRDEDMSRVIPLTEESLVTPTCGQRNLEMLGFYEKDWGTISIPKELLQ